MNLAELKEAYKARKLALDSAKKEEEKYKALLKDAMLEAGESDYTDEAGYRFERIVQERKSMDEEKLLAELHERNLTSCIATKEVVDEDATLKAVEAGELPQEVLADLKEEERDVRAAEKNEIITILEACTNCRDQVLILLTSELGFRIGEILGIDYTKDIDYETHEIRVNFREDNENDARAKNAEERRGRLSDDTFEFLLYYIGEYWDILQKQEYLFINIKGDTTGKPMKVDSVYDMFERMEKKTGIKITPHMLRRYYANTRWEADWPLEMISQALGHKHLDTTIRYLNVLDDKLRTASQEFYRRYSNLYNVNQFLESRR